MAESSGTESVKVDDGWMDILENGQLMKKTSKPGDTSRERPQRACKVTLNLKTILQESGQDVESETIENAVGFVGDYDFIHGVDLALPLMFPGEVAKVVIAPRFAFGDQGKEPDVPPNATLEVDVELLDVEWVDSENLFSLEDRLRFGESKKERGNFWYKRNDASTAIHCYRRAVEFSDATDEEMDLYHTEAPEALSDENKLQLLEQKAKIKQMLDLRTVALNNLAAAQMKTEAFEAALRSVNSVLQVDERNVKALYRKGKILAATGEIGDAISALTSAAKLDPTNRAVLHELNLLGVKKRQEVDKEKMMYQRMLQTNPAKEATLREKVKRKAAVKKWGLLAGSISIAVAILSFLLYHFYQV
ncbi:Peptidyl-prolyl cis-trans isomerase FKBP8 [Halotydeus destructor]|nr:Peptidyl-prolyl cis-trans isomerase FKBP8 [Halotydeus destructor]